MRVRFRSFDAQERLLAWASEGVAKIACLRSKPWITALCAVLLSPNVIHAETRPRARGDPFSRGVLFGDRRTAQSAVLQGSLRSQAQNHAQIGFLQLPL